MKREREKTCSDLQLELHLAVRKESPGSASAGPLPLFFQEFLHFGIRRKKPNSSEVFFLLLSFPPRSALIISLTHLVSIPADITSVDQGERREVPRKKPKDSKHVRSNTGSGGVLRGTLRELSGRPRQMVRASRQGPRDVGKQLNKERENRCNTSLGEICLWGNIFIHCLEKSRV